MKYVSVIAGLGLAVLAGVLLLSKTGGEADFSRTDYLMNTAVTVTIPAGYEAAADKAFLKMRRLAGMADAWSEDSALSDLNRERECRVPSELYALIVQALEISRSTEGAFDPTTGGLSLLWGFKSDDRRVPADVEIAAVMNIVGYETVKVLPDNHVRLPGRDMLLDLGAMAKGAVVDLAVDSLIADGVPYGIVDAGGDLRSWGQKRSDALWVIGVQHPRRAQALLGRISSRQPLAIATSGDYQRYFEQDGRRYSHILDPRTGYPAQGLISATVIAETAAEADAMATAVYVLGPGQGMKQLRKSGLEGVIVMRDGRIVTTEGLADMFVEEAAHGFEP